MRLGKLFIVAVPGEFTTMAGLTYLTYLTIQWWHEWTVSTSFLTGRRLRNTVHQALNDASANFSDAIVVIAGLSNEVKKKFPKKTFKKRCPEKKYPFIFDLLFISLYCKKKKYTHYITTYEEYQQQRYEGASTLYGPHTLAAYQQEFYRFDKKKINNNLKKSEKSEKIRKKSEK